MKLREKLFHVFAPPDVRDYLDSKIEKREARVRRLEDEQARLERLTKMLEVKGGEPHGK